MVYTTNTYYPELFKQLPGVLSARQAFEELDGQKLKDDLFRDLFISHGAHTKFGLALLHRHFNIANDERLVEHLHTTTPWKANNDYEASFTKYEGHVVPRSYMFADGVPVPYEFAYVDKEDDEFDEKDNTFLSELSATLTSHGLDKVLGFRRLDGTEVDSEYIVETTEGKANIMLKSGSIPSSKTLEAFWIFGPNGNHDEVCAWVCVQDPQAGHVGEHQE